MNRALLLVALIPTTLHAQFLTGEAPKQQPNTPPPLPYSTLLANLTPRNVGPTTMGGRVTDIAVYEKDPRIFYVGAASGGVWRTDNGGMTFKPTFNKETTANIGAVAVSQKNPDLVWVGTGEGTSRNSVGWGNGIYKSEDGGKTYKNMGLPESYHFSRIIIDPSDNNTVYAGALGGLWGYNQERGVYKTTDGGKSWKRILFVDEKTGIGDMAMDPSNPKILIAAAWERLRTPYTWISGGPSSALYRTTDGGANWHKITKGVPTGNLGRIGISFYRKDPRQVVATFEARPGGVFKSKDAGESWEKLNLLNPRPFYFSIPRIDPNDSKRVYVPGVNISYSDDGGTTYKQMRSSVHVDHHAMWIDPNDSNHMIIGEDGGVGQTRDKGATWEHLNYLPIGQFYAVAYDMRKPYWVYGGLQDNGCWAGPTQTSHGGVAFWDFYNVGQGDGFHVSIDPENWTTVYSESQGGGIVRIDQKYGGGASIQPRAPRGESYRFNWSSPFLLSPFNSTTIYMGGNRLFKSVDRGDHWKPISPDLSTNDPLKLSPGKYYRSSKKDDFIESVSPEDTGAERYGTIITISESPTKQGMLWVGTDDGLVQMTEDDGAKWTNLTANIKGVPANTWVSRVVASRFDENRAYATFDGHRSNDFNTYVFMTTDKGKTWTSIKSNLPNEPVYVIKEGLKNPDLLFLGTEFGLYVSFDRGTSWTKYTTGDWPTVPVHDIEIHPRDGDLLLATHGRSIWIIPESALEEMTAENLAKDVVLAKPGPVYKFGRVDNGGWDGDRIWQSANTQPGTTICYYLKKDAGGDVKVSIQDAAGREVSSLNGSGKPGLNTVTWNGRARGAFAPDGTYRVSIKVGGKEYLTQVTVEDVTDQMNASPPRITSSSNRNGFEFEKENEREGDGG